MSLQKLVQQHFELQNQPEKVQLQITFNHSLRQLKTFITVKKYPYTALDVAQTQERTTLHSKFKQILEGITQLTQKQPRISSLFIILPFQTQDGHSAQLSELFSKLIEQYRSFLTTVLLYNVSSSVTASLLSSSIRFLRCLQLNNCQMSPEQLAKSRFKYLQEISLKGSWFGNKGLQQLCKADWPQLTHLEFRDEAVTLDGTKCLHKSRFQLTSLDLFCDDESWIRNLVGLQAEFITVSKAIKFSSAILRMNRRLGFINQIAKKQSIGQSFSQQPSYSQLRAVFKSKIIIN